MVQEENKRKYAHWFHPSAIKLAEDLMQHDNCGSRSEFIEKAILFYAGYITEKDASLFLSRSLVSTMRGMLDDTENRMSTLLFKLTVEVSILMNVLAAMTDVDDDTLYKLRHKCVEDAKRSNGSISFAAVVKSHRQREL